jgi:hypothetical protein
VAVVSAFRLSNRERESRSLNGAPVSTSPASSTTAEPAAGGVAKPAVDSVEIRPRLRNTLGAHMYEDSWPVAEAVKP